MCCCAELIIVQNKKYHNAFFKKCVDNWKIFNFQFLFFYRRRAEADYGNDDSAKKSYEQNFIYIEAGFAEHDIRGREPNYRDR
jgi:hypothetical protein